MSVDPYTAATISLSALSKGSEFVGQSNLAKSQNQRVTLQRNNIIKDRDNKYAQAKLKARNEGKRASQKIDAAQRKTAKVVSNANVAALEGGAGGGSVDALISDLYREFGEFEASVIGNTEAIEQEINAELLGINTLAQNRVNSLKPGNKPSAFNSVLGFADDNFAEFLELIEYE